MAGPFTDAELGVLREAQQQGRLSIEQKQAIKARYDEWAQQQGPAPFQQSFTGGLNVGIAKMAGAPIDLTTFVMNLAGADIEHPAGGSEQIQEAMAKVGLAPELGQDYENKFVGRMAEELGAAPIALIPMAAAAKYSKSALPVLETFRASPKMFVASEMGAAAGAGVGAATAQKAFPNNPLAELLGSVAGGLANPLAVLSRVSRPAVRGLRKMAFPFTKTGVKVEAAKQIGRTVEKLSKKTPQELAKAIDEETIIKELSPGEKTLDPALLALERAVIASNAEAEGRFAQMANNAQRAIRRELEDIGGEVGTEFDARQLMQQRIDYLKALLERRATNAVRIAKDRIDDIRRTGGTRSEASSIARNEIEKALKDARTQEKAFYDAIDPSLATSTTDTYQAFYNILSTRGKFANPDDIPRYVHDAFGELDEAGKLTGGLLSESESIDNIRTFRSRILQSIREEQAKDAPNRTKIHILDELQESILDDIGKNAAANTQVQLAHQFSKDLNDTFTRGTVGKLLGYEKVGGVTVPSNLTLTRALSEAGPAAANAYDDLIGASSNTESMKAAIQDYVRVNFANQVQNADGKVSIQSIKRFTDRNKELLDKMPEFKKAIQDTDKAQRIADATNLSVKGRTKSILDRQKSKAALFLDAPVGKVINRIRKSRNPEETTKQIVRQLQKDETGMAIEGFRRMWIDEIMGEIQMKKLTDEGLPVIDGTNLRNFVAKNYNSLKHVFDKEEMSRFVKIGDEASRIDAAARKGIKIDDVLQDTPSMLLETLARIAGARLGSQVAGKAGPGSLVAAGRGSSYMRSLLMKIPMERTRDLITEAVLDKEMMKTLLTKIDTPLKLQQVDQKLHAWLFYAIPRELERTPEDVPSDIPPTPENLQ
jgi:hypothetical protein